MSENFLLEAVHIRKTFNNGQVIANDDVSLQVKENEIHALIGENGAGKSTLMSILFGLSKPDSGKIYFEGKEVLFKNAREATKAGLGLVQQHFSQVENYSVLNNIILGAEPTKGGMVDRKKAKKIILDLIKKYNLQVKLNARLGNLSVAQRQKVEILKVLFRQSKVIILDEPTAVLSELEIASFLNILKVFKQQGHTIILITHKLKEVKEVADTATVIRRGRFIKRVSVADTSTSEMAELMVGHKLVEVKNEAPVDHFDTPVILKVNNLDLEKSHTFESLFKVIQSNIKKKYFKKKNNENQEPEVATDHPIKKTISFEVHAGEIFAVAGVAGNGQSRLAELITGMTTSDKGTIQFLSKDTSHWKISKRRHFGLSYVPEDRHRVGLTLDDACRMNLVENMISDKQFSFCGFIKKFKIMLHANNMIEKFDIRGTISGAAIVRSLSGGNQQKIILARELYTNHELLVLVQPTRGLDVLAVQYVHQRIMEEKKKNKAILLISYELDEIFALADTITVISKNEFLGIYPRSQMNYEKIGQLMGGEKYE